MAASELGNTESQQLKRIQIPGIWQAVLIMYGIPQIAQQYSASK